MVCPYVSVCTSKDIGYCIAVQVFVFSGGSTDHCSQEDTGEEVSKMAKNKPSLSDITHELTIATPSYYTAIGSGMFVEKYR